MATSKWSFTIDQLINTPSRKCGVDGEKESNYRQQSASLIQDMGQRLQVYPFCTEPNRIGAGVERSVLLSVQRTENNGLLALFSVRQGRI